MAGCANLESLLCRELILVASVTDGTIAFCRRGSANMGVYYWAVFARYRTL